MHLDTSIIGRLTPLDVTIEGAWSPAPDTVTSLMLVDGRWEPDPSRRVMQSQMIDGQWIDTPALLAPGIICVAGQYTLASCREWYGRATAAEPFVAMTFHRTPAGCTWVKSTRSYESRYVRLWLTAGNEISVMTDIQHGLSYSQTLLNSPYDRPNISGSQSFRAGVTRRFTRIDGEPPLEVHFLFLARRDVRVTRSGLWRLRPEHLDAIADPAIRRMVGDGRAGNLPP